VLFPRRAPGAKRRRTDPNRCQRLAHGRAGEFGDVARDVIVLAALISAALALPYQLVALTTPRWVSKGDNYPSRSGRRASSPGRVGWKWHLTCGGARSGRLTVLDFVPGTCDDVDGRSLVDRI
jgi:hypothetical protein